MDGMIRTSGRRTKRLQSDGGFSLVEVVVASGVLVAGLLSLASVFALGMVHMAGSSPGIIAREKAREAVESVHTARDTGDLPWAKIRNTPAPGVFVTGEQDLKTAGPDGLVNSADDGPDLEVLAGDDNTFGTDDDQPLVDYKREIQITNLFADGSTTVVNPNLRQIRVIIRYKVAGTWRTYTLTTYISSFS
jgi:hypothetical protein